jgi:hypothetical protein
MHTALLLLNVFGLVAGNVRGLLSAADDVEHNSELSGSQKPTVCSKIPVMLPPKATLAVTFAFTASLRAVTVAAGALQVPD